jgi:hypothetical protein
VRTAADCKVSLVWGQLGRSVQAPITFVAARMVPDPMRRSIDDRPTDTQFGDRRLISGANKPP